jgi:hypothetical protein
MDTLFRFLVGITLLFCLFTSLRAKGSGLVESPYARNHALLVGVSHGLPGIDYDIRNLTTIATHPTNNFDAKTMRDSEATVSAVSGALEEKAGKIIDMQGTFLFYFSGHGGNKIISMQDTLMNISEIRAAIERGRQKMGPLPRLVLVFDSCDSGSLIDPLNLLFRSRYELNAHLSVQLMEKIMEVFSPSSDRDSRNYWHHLIVFTSARADETCEAGSEGSDFTKAFFKAFQEAIQNPIKVKEFIGRFQKYTQDSHPQARLNPEELGDELVIAQW